MFLIKNVEELNDLFLRNSEMYLLLNEKDRKTFYDFTNTLNKFGNLKPLWSFLLLQENNYSIEITWRLHSQQIIDFAEFISRYKWDPDEIITTLLSLSESKDELHQIILTDLFISLLLLLSGEPNTHFNSHLRIIQQFLIHSSSLIMKNPDAWIYLKRVKCSPLCIKSTAKRMFKIMLKNMLATDLNYYLDVAYEEYRMYKTSESIYRMLEMMLDLLDENIIFSLIQNVIFEMPNKANWKMILSLITVFVKTKSQQSHKLKLKFEHLLNHTLSKSELNDEFTLCKATLLVFRHCCLDIGLWSEYRRWYSSYKPSVETAQNFYKLLTHLIPYDLPAALASHTNTQPTLTESCVAIQNTYVKVAREQLVKINKGQDTMGLFKDYDDTENRHEADVVKVLESYKKTGQVMRVVLEASVFRKTYFVNTFLKTLMDPHMQDDQIRCEFIEKLNDINKIPNSIYTKWKNESRSKYF
ncbi:Fanconi anemia group A protein homolog [Adelges cooleyi]|uniref:Fanconi anemia group A protein homolog n=1 Tax=Adelges cooleyi TaxID=133065 RepID=UPI0021806804|nr:Fanconi anemia group A protein homolog [Adelges cooleyi]XP_050436473.1 Fanconi anemia group A protein homolog [Adelges cooleyi]